MRKIIDSIMNHLEKDLNVDTLDPMIREVNMKMSSLRGLIRSLHLAAPHNKGKTKTPDNLFDNWL